MAKRLGKIFFIVVKLFSTPSKKASYVLTFLITPKLIINKTYKTANMSVPKDFVINKYTHEVQEKIRKAG